MIDILAISHASFTAVNREVYCRLKEWGYNLELVVPAELNYSSGKKMAQPMREKDPNIHFLTPSHSNPRILSYHGLVKILESSQPKIVFLDNDPASKLAVSLGVWCQKNKSILICQSCENLSFKLWPSFQRQGVKGILLSFFKLSLIASSKKRISHVFTISNDGSKIFNELGFASVSKTPLGFNEKLFFPNSESANRLRDKLMIKTTVIAYFGRVVFEKGIHVLLKALAEVKEKDWVLMMDEFDLYATEYALEIKKQIKDLGLQDRVIHIHADHEEIADYMNVADLVILPSVSTPKWKEQYGRVIPEAMACNSAVIVSDTGALPELVGDAGLIVAENDVEALQLAIMRLLGNKDELNNYKLLAQNRAFNILGVESQLKEYIRVFDQWL